MHEISMVRSLLRQVGEIVAEERAGAVRAIRVQCGPLSGVEPALMLSAFRQIQADNDVCPELFTAADLVIDVVPLQAQCGHCAVMFEPQGFRFRCPECGSTDTEVLRGDGVWIESIELESLEGDVA